MQDYNDYMAVGHVCDNCGLDSYNREMFRIEHHVICLDCLEFDFKNVLKIIKPKPASIQMKGELDESA